MALKLKAGGGLFSVSATTGKLSCACCCTDTTAIEWKSRSASKTKCGFSEYSGYVSSPPKRYSVKTLSGTAIYVPDGSPIWQGSGSGIYDSSCACTSTMMEVLSSTSLPCSATIASTIGNANIRSSTQDASDRAAFGPNSSGTISYDLSSEYTTATLKSNTTAALSAYTATWTGTAGSYYNLTTDELTNSIRQAKYRFSFTIPSGTCYKIEWTEGSTPMSWEWDGTGTPGTTGYSPEYEIPIPTTNTTVTVTGISSTCTGC